MADLKYFYQCGCYKKKKKRDKILFNNNIASYQLSNRDTNRFFSQFVGTIISLKIFLLQNLKFQIKVGSGSCPHSALSGSDIANQCYLEI